MRPRDVWALFRLHAAGTYAVVAVTAGLFGTLSPDQIMNRVILLFVPFVVLLYGGIYTINGIADRKDDALHATKRLRPVASGRVRVSHAWALACCSIALGLSCAWILGGIGLTSIFTGFLALNAFYTFVAKRLPYVELLFNGSTYLLRGVLGAVIGGGLLPAAAGWSLFWAVVGVSAARRMGELLDGHAASRSTLRWYRPEHLRLLYHACTGAILLGIASAEGASSIAAQLIVLAAHVTVSYGSEVYAGLRRAAQW